jgi:hypothetical protein
MTHAVTTNLTTRNPIKKRSNSPILPQVSGNNQAQKKGIAIQITIKSSDLNHPLILNKCSPTKPTKEGKLLRRLT